MLTALLEAGADVDQTDDNGNTALMTAAENGNDKMAEILNFLGERPNTAASKTWANA